MSLLHEHISDLDCKIIGCLPVEPNVRDIKDLLNYLCRSWWWNCFPFFILEYYYVANVYLDIQEKNVYTLSQTIKYTFALEMDSAHESKFTGICCSGWTIDLASFLCWNSEWLDT